MKKFLYRHGCDATDVRDLAVLAALIAMVAVWAAIGCGA